MDTLYFLRERDGVDTFYFTLDCTCKELSLKSMEIGNSGYNEMQILAIGLVRDVVVARDREELWREEEIKRNCHATNRKRKQSESRGEKNLSRDDLDLFHCSRSICW